MPKPVLFYDGQCPLCRREIAHYQRLDSDQRVDWQDLFSEQCSLDQYSLNPVEAMKVIHAVDHDGNVQPGVYAFMTIWQELPYYRRLAWLLKRLHLVGLLDRAYHRFARWRFRRRCDQGCKIPGTSSD